MNRHRQYGRGRWCGWIAGALSCVLTSTASAALPQVSISDARIVEGDAGARRMVFEVRASGGPIAGQATVAYTITHGTTDASDLAATSGVVALRPVPGRFLEPWAAGAIHNASYLDRAPDGSIVVGDTQTHELRRYDGTGALIQTIGGFGTEPGQFSGGPDRPAFDAAGNLYVSDWDNDRIQKFSPGGELLAAWGSPGNGPGGIDRPSDIALDGDGNLYVVDAGNDRIVKLAPDGSFLHAWPVPGDYEVLHGLAVSPSGKVFVSDSDERVSVFTLDGTHLATWTAASTGGRLDLPHGLVADGRGNLYIADTSNERVVVVREDGTYVTEWEVLDPSPLRDPGGAIVYSVAVGDDGSTYVSDGYTQSILRHAPITWAGRIEVEIAGDTTFEPDETFTVTLSGAEEATLADAEAVGTIVNDDPDLGPNQVGNPGFEESLDGWVVYQGTALARTDAGRSGAFAAVVTGPDSIGTFGVNDSPDWTRAPVVHMRHRFTAWVRGLGDAGKARLRVREYLGDLQMGVYESADVVVANEWRRLTLVVRNLEPGSNLDFQVLYDPAAPNAAFAIDDVAVEPLGPDVPPVIVVADAIEHPWMRTLTFPVSAYDPDGESIRRLELDASDAPGAELELSGDGAQGVLRWRPGAGAVREIPRTLTFTARNALVTTATTAIRVVNNLVVDPSFESGIAGWNGYFGGVLERVAGRAGGHAMRVTVPPATRWAGVTDSPDWVSEDLASHALSVTYRAWMRAPDPVADLESRFWIREFGGTGLAGQVDWRRPLGVEWERASVSYTATGQGDHLDLVLALSPAAANRVFEVDDVAIRVRLLGVADAPVAEPAVAALGLRAWPNPARGRVSLALELPRAGDVRVTLHDVAGRRVADVAQGWRAAGRHVLALDLARAGRALEAGIYFVRARTPDGVRTARLAVLE